MVNVKILGISTSPRHANTEIAVKWALEAAAKLPGVETEFVSLAEKTIYPCDGCRKCIGAAKDNPCPRIQEDDFKEICFKMVDPDVDGFIMGAMTDFQQAGATWHCLKSRLLCAELSQLGPSALRCKVFGGIAIGSVPYGGQSTVLQQLLMWAHHYDMYAVACGPEVGKVCGGYLGASGSTCHVLECSRIFRGRGPLYPNTPAEVEAIKEDECCKAQCENLGGRVAETAKIIKAGYEAVPIEELRWAKGPIKVGGYDYTGTYNGKGKA